MAAEVAAQVAAEVAAEVAVEVAAEVAAVQYMDLILVLCSHLTGEDHNFITIFHEIKTKCFSEPLNAWDARFQNNGQNALLALDQPMSSRYF